MDSASKKLVYIAFAISFIFVLLITFIFCSCTLSFQNVSTHGQATDLVDDNLSTTPTIDLKNGAL